MQNTKAVRSKRTIWARIQLRLLKFLMVTFAILTRVFHPSECEDRKTNLYDVVVEKLHEKRGYSPAILWVCKEILMGTPFAVLVYWIIKIVLLKT